MADLAAKQVDLEAIRSVLVYKRTHPGDPRDGVFGFEDCMGAVRARDFEAVIGVGGIGSEARSHNLDGKLNYVGVGARKHRWFGRGPLVTFDRYVDFGVSGPAFRDVAPQLAQRMLGRNARVVQTFSDEEWREVLAILALADGAPSSHGQPMPSGGRTRSCPSPICRPLRPGRCP